MNVKDANRLIEDPKVSVLIDDAGLTISAGKSIRAVERAKTTEIVDKQGFLLLFCGNINLACLPKKFMSEAQVDFVKSWTNK